MTRFDADAEIEAELPDGLQSLALTYSFHPGIERKDDYDGIDWFYHHDLNTLFNSVGAALMIDAKDLPFSDGEKNEHKLWVGIVGAPSVLQRWMQDERGRFSLEKLGFDISKTRGPKDRTLGYLKWKLFSNFKVPQWFWEQNDDTVYLNKVPLDLDELYKTPGTFTRWIKNAQATDEDFAQLAALAEASGGDIIRAAKVITKSMVLENPKPTSFLVPTLIPYASVTELAGNRKVGKSASLLELAVSAARREQSWAGFALNPVNGIVVYLSGEDTKEETFSRVMRMTGGSPPYTLWIEDSSGIDAILKSLRGQKVALLAVDPARKYYVGDEDSSDAASGFFTKLENFAHEAGAAVVVSHHLKKGAHPKNVHDVANYIRGSGVFLDRPRVILAMHRTGTETQLAIPALDGAPLHNFRQSEMFSGVRRLRRDEKTFRHVPIDEATASTTKKEVGQGDTDRILEAARGLLAASERLTRTGPAALFERKLPQLAGLSRATVRAGVDALVSQGQLNSDGAGVLTLPAATNEEEKLLELLS
jgi:hypothetical protein